MNDMELELARRRRVIQGLLDHFKFIVLTVNRPLWNGEQVPVSTDYDLGEAVVIGASTREEFMEQNKYAVANLNGTRIPSDDWVYGHFYRVAAE